MVGSGRVGVAGFPQGQQSHTLTWEFDHVSWQAGLRQRDRCSDGGGRGWRRCGAAYAFSRLALWTVIAAGPVALGAAITSTPTTVDTAAEAKPTAVRTTAHAADPGGYAQLFVSAWLRSSADDTTSAQARLAQSMAPDVELPDPAADTPSKPQSVTAVRSAQREGGTWSVAVAAQYADGSVRYYAVPVAADHAGASFTVTGAPGVVAGPARAEAPTPPYGVTVPEGDLSSAVGEFLAAYLTGAGEVSRYLAPGVKCRPSPPPRTRPSRCSRYTQSRRRRPPSRCRPTAPRSASSSRWKPGTRAGGGRWHTKSR